MRKILLSLFFLLPLGAYSQDQTATTEATISPPSQSPWGLQMSVDHYPPFIQTKIGGNLSYRVNEKNQVYFSQEVNQIGATFTPVIGRTEVGHNYRILSERNWSLGFQQEVEFRGSTYTGELNYGRSYYQNRLNAQYSNGIQTFFGGAQVPGIPTTVWFHSIAAAYTMADNWNVSAESGSPVTKWGPYVAAGAVHTLTPQTNLKASVTMPYVGNPIFAVGLDYDFNI